MIKENLTKKKRESKVYVDKKFEEMNSGLKLDAERCMKTLYSVQYMQIHAIKGKLFSANMSLTRLAVLPLPWVHSFGPGLKSSRLETTIEATRFYDQVVIDFFGVKNHEVGRGLVKGGGGGGHSL